MKKSVVMYSKLFRILLSAYVSLLALATGASFAQSIEFFQGIDASGEYDVLQYSLLPDNLPLDEGEEGHIIEHRLFVKKLSGEWMSEVAALVLEEEIFIQNLIDVYNNLTVPEELELVLDETSYLRKLDIYESNPNEIRIDRNKYAEWIDVRPFAVVRYGNMHLIVCDIKKNNLQAEYETEVINTVYHQSVYRLTEALDQVDAYDGIVSSYLHPNMAEGRILAALRSHAGVVDN